MQIPSTPTAYGGSEAQRLLGMLLQQQQAAAGQNLPGAATTTPAAPAAATAQTTTLSSAQFASDTLSSLLSAQEAPASSANVAAQVIGAADTNGDGSLSLSEVQQAIGGDTTSGSSSLSQAFSQIDTNGDGQISASELTNALSAQNAAQNAGGSSQAQAAHRHHHHGGQGAGGASSSTDLASQLLGSADTNGDGQLSVAEIQNALGASSTSSTSSTSSASSTSAASSTSSTDALSSAIAKLDTNGDGQLSASELSAGIDAFRAAHHRGGTQWAQAQSTVTA